MMVGEGRPALGRLVMQRGGRGRRRELGPYRWVPPAGIILGVLVGVVLGNPAIGAILAIVLGLGAFMAVRLFVPRG